MAIALRRNKLGRDKAARNHILIRITPVLVAFCVLGLPQSILERAVVVIVGVIALSYLSTRPGPVAMSLIAGFVVMQIVLPIMLRIGVPQPMVRMAVFWKEALVGTLVLAAVRHRRHRPTRPDVIDGLAAAYIALVTAYWLFPGALTSYPIPISSSASQVALRSAALPVIGLLAVRHAGIPDVWRRRCLGAAIFVGVMLTIGSILEMSFPHWWDNFLSNTVGLLPYQHAVLGSGRTSILSYADFNNARSQRSGSWYADPLLVGFTYHLPLAAALAWSLAKPTFRALATLGFIGAGLFLVQGRAALLGGVVVFIVALRRRDEKTSRVTRTNLVMLIAAGVIIAFPFFASSALGQRSAGAINGEDTISAPDHIEASKAALQRVIALPLGTGLGSSGGQAVRFGVTQGSISENYFLGIGVDVGVAGMLLYVALFLAVFRQGTRIHNDALGFAAVSGLIGVAVGSLFLHGLESPVSSVPALVAVGFAVIPKVDRAAEGADVDGSKGELQPAYR